MLDRRGYQVKNLCENYKNKEEVKSIIKDIENSPEKYKSKPKWEYYSLGDLFTADYKFLFPYNWRILFIFPEKNYWITNYWIFRQLEKKNLNNKELN